MKAKIMQQRLRPYILPLAMGLGILFHSEIQAVRFMSPYLIFAMLLITFCRVSPREFKTTRFIWILLTTQFLLAAVAFIIIKPLNIEVAQSTIICILCPTATAAPVVTGMLGGSVALLTTYSVVSNVAVAVTAPFIFTWIGATADVSTGDIAWRVLPIILNPLILALIMQRYFKRAHHAIAAHQSVSFYIWAVALVIVVGNAVSFIIAEPTDRIPEMITMALLALLACIIQFASGRLIGRRFGNKVSGAQGLGQKNTVLAIWMALSYFNPITSVGAAAYVAWQNIINSWQLYRHLRSTSDKQLSI